MNISIKIFLLISPFLLSSLLHANSLEETLIVKNQKTYLLADTSISITETIENEFLPIESIPDLLNRDKGKAIWMKSEMRINSNAELIFDFIRKDFVCMYIFQSDSLIASYQTGFLLSGKRKRMGRWNAIDADLKADTDYTIYYRFYNVMHNPDLKILINERKIWREGILESMIKDIAFLSVILIVAIFSLLMFFENKLKAFLYFSLYLLSIFIFYLYILNVFRDFFLKSDPYITIYSVSVILLTPFFYLRFMRSFLNTNLSMPKWDKVYYYLANGNLGLFFLMISYYFFFEDYYLFLDVIRLALVVNVFAGLLLLYLVWDRKNPLVIYFVLGSMSMLLFVMADVLVWTNSQSLGIFARIGFLMEIVFFSMGLGKKSRMQVKEKEVAQESYIDQLKINEELIRDQKSKLELEVKEKIKQYKEAKEEAEFNAKVKEDFLSVMSHEIRTPMNAIVGLTHMLDPNDTEQDYRENITTLRYSVDNLTLLINNVLDYNKISAGKVELEAVDFDLKKIIMGICHLFKTKADSKRLDFSIKTCGDIPVMVNGDPFRLSQILNNFLSNAIKFTEKGFIKLEIELISHVNGEYALQFQVIDSGVGIPASQQDQVFVSFAQAGNDTARKYGGTGLGLAIAKDLIELMGGSIELESEPDKGSTFKFQTVFKDPQKNTTSEEEETLFSGVKDLVLADLSVLIVDDNQLNRLILKKFMKRWKVASSEAENGIEALKRLREAHFDIVLLDLQMPEMDGYELSEEMMKDKQLSSIPIIAISADTISNVYENVTAAGMDDFITKPFNPDELKNKIYTLTSKTK